MDSVGDRLRQARVRAGLSLGEISARTKIRTALLDALESGDFTRLPQGLLGRGFLRAYAREVGLDPEAIVRQFQDELGHDAAGGKESSAAAFASDGRTSVGAGPSWQKQLLVPAAIALLAGALVIYLNRSPTMDVPLVFEPIGTAGPDAEARADSSPDAEPAAQSQPAAEGAGDVVAAVGIAEPDVLSVVILPVGLVWVEATADGARVLYALVRAGERRTIDVRQELLLRVGDAGAFRYSIDGVPGRPVGAAGVVRDLRITRQNYTAYQDR